MVHVSCRNAMTAIQCVNRLQQRPFSGAQKHVWSPSESFLSLLWVLRHINAARLTKYNHIQFIQLLKLSRLSILSWQIYYLLHLDQSMKQSVAVYLNKVTNWIILVKSPSDQCLQSATTAPIMTQQMVYAVPPSQCPCVCSSTLCSLMTFNSSWPSEYPALWESHLS